MSGRILVTGAGGYIGSAIVAHLAEKNLKVRAFGHDTRFAELSRLASGDVDFHPGELLDADSLAGALDGVEAWCVLDAERKVVWDATREASARRDLEHVADIGSRIPKYLRGYGVMGDICEVTLEGDPRGPHRCSYTPARGGLPAPQT